MADKSLSQRWQDYNPSKAVWAWSCVACIVLTMIVGFTAGGWVTGGTADERVADATENARADVVASLCVDKFATATNASMMLDDLKAAKSWEQDDFIEEGGWVTFAGLEGGASDAADLCADRLVAMEELPAQVVEPDPAVVDPVESDG